MNSFAFKLGQLVKEAENNPLAISALAALLGGGIGAASTLANTHPNEDKRWRKVLENAAGSALISGGGTYLINSMHDR